MTNRKKVLVVGAGPAGLNCAETLAVHGCAVTVFEKESFAGGFLNLIPTRRFNKNYIADMLDKISRHGVKVEFNRAIDFAEIGNLLNDFDFVVLATGTPRSKTLDLPNKKTINSIDFLKSSITAPTVGVIGGGNIAIDCACAGIERGADTTIYYRRTRADMKAAAHEVAFAEKHGVKFVFNVTDFAAVDADLVVFAIGLAADIPENLPERVFVCGDARVGSSNIANAVKNAREIAKTIASI